jgi:ubiquinone/menaquinone biosynthesis C-methylase UbiE
MMLTATPDLEAIKRKQREMWASGDYAAVATAIPLISELLCDSADLRAGWRVLDVAGGSGNTALAAARCGCRVVSIDYVPELLERARRRAAAEHLDLELLEADAESLPFEDASFDAVISAVGVMFAPDHRRAARELLRTCRPGGTIALASWTPEGFIGGLLQTVAAHVAPPPGVQPAVLWGSEEHVRDLFGDGVVGLRVLRRRYTFRYRSPEHFVDFFRTHYGPLVKAFAALDDAGQAALASDLAALVRRFDRLTDEPGVAIPAEYLEVVATRA